MISKNLYPVEGRVMKKFSWLICALAIPFNFAFAQKLPTGAYHADRERNYDILHYKAELAFDFEKKQVFGKSTIRLTPLRRIENFAFDAIHLNVKGVSSTESTNGLAFRSTGDSLIITLPQARIPADTLTVVVQYEATPKSGMYFQRNPDNPQLF
jgi:aminopeptidase N